MQSAEKLVMMANQIVRNLAAQGEDKAVMLAADHMRKFWEPRMRNQIHEHVNGGAPNLSPLAKRAVEELARLETAKS